MVVQVGGLVGICIFSSFVSPNLSSVCARCSYAAPSVRIGVVRGSDTRWLTTTWRLCSCPGEHSDDLVCLSASSLALSLTHIDEFLAVLRSTHLFPLHDFPVERQEIVAKHTLTHRTYRQRADRCWTECE